MDPRFISQTIQGCPPYLGCPLLRCQNGTSKPGQRKASELRKQTEKKKEIKKWTPSKSISQWEQQIISVKVRNVPRILGRSRAGSA